MYNAEYNIKMSYGHYIWCGNMSAPPGSGFFLNPTEIKDGYGEPCTNFMTLMLKMNDELLSKTRVIELYDYTGFLFGYYPAGEDQFNKNIVTFYKKIQPDLIGTTLKIKFGSFKNSNNIWYRPPLNCVFEGEIIIPDIQIKSDNICKICLDEVNDPKDKYIGPCGHTSHMQCLWEYLEKNDLLLPLPERCTRNCCNSKKYLQFRCLYCQAVNFR
jgi:Zinc finger, C3HC4 type (RING finger)